MSARNFYGTFAALCVLVFIIAAAVMVSGIIDNSFPRFLWAAFVAVIALWFGQSASELLKKEIAKEDPKQTKLPL